MLRRELTKKGLARALSLVLAVSLAMPGTALAAATQPSPNEAAVESVYEEEAAEEEAAAGETAVLMGESGEEEITAEDLAAWCGTLLAERRQHSSTMFFHRLRPAGLWSVRRGSTQRAP